MGDASLKGILNIDSSCRFVKKYLRLIALLVSLVIASIFMAFNMSTSRAYLRQLHEQGQSFFEEIVVTRQWVAVHGGVYVPLDTTDGVNPYLAKIEGVESVIEADGRLYTLKNPALVTRELSESPGHGGKLKYKITSLKTLNPGNAPDRFEQESLKLFEDGVQENAAMEKMDGKLYYRYMGPLMTVEACLKCHDHQGYKEGDIRGGIAVSILAEDVSGRIRQARMYMVVSGLGVVILVVLSILYIARYFQRDLRRAQEALATMAMTDPLTGLYNRRTAMDLLRKELARCQRTEKPLSLVIIDLDHFKKVNDTYGHSVGDEVLISLAKMLQETVREYDIGCRYGGEEFLLIMPGANLENAVKTAERLLTRVMTSPVQTAKGDLSLSFSAGAAQYQTGEEADVLIDRADALLYEAKAQGRKRVVS